MTVIINNEQTTGSFMKLQKLKDWADDHFETKVPTRTLQSWCENGHIPARKMGKFWFVDLEAMKSSTGNELADQILRAG